MVSQTSQQEQPANSGTDAGECPPTEISRLAEHLFRHESAKMVATLTRIFGIEHLNLAEDVVQEALGRALQTWPYRGVPENPSAWIMRASRNLALDVIRREKVFRGKEAEIARLIEASGASIAGAVSFSENEIADDRLRMMFVCCHPIIPPEAQVALALKTLCGFNVIRRDTFAVAVHDADGDLGGNIPLVGQCFEETIGGLVVTLEIGPGGILERPGDCRKDEDQGEDRYHDGGSSSHMPPHR